MKSLLVAVATAALLAMWSQHVRSEAPVENGWVEVASMLLVQPVR